MDRQVRAKGSLVGMGWERLGDDSFTNVSYAGIVLDVTPTTIDIKDGEDRLARYGIADWDAANTFVQGYHLGVTRAASPAYGQ